MKAALEALKLSPRKLVAISAVLGFLLLAKPEWREVLGVSALVENHRAVMGVGFLVAVALLLADLGTHLARKVRHTLARSHLKRRVLQRLRTLSEDEKQILRFYVAQNTRTNSLRIDDAVAQGLAADGVIALAGNFGNALDGFPYRIADVVWSELQKEPGLLDGSTNTYRTDRTERFW